MAKLIDTLVDAVRPYHCLMDPDVELRALLEVFQRTAARSMLELGTYRGGTSAFMKLACPAAEVWTVDLPDPSRSTFNPQPRSLTGRAFSDLNVPVLQLWHDSADIVAVCGKQRFDMVFVDADHSEAAVYRDLWSASALLEQDGIIVVHDFTDQSDPAPRPHWTIDVERACRRFCVEASFKIERLAGWLAALYLPGTMPDPDRKVVDDGP
jgi:predicted O-methyltransferase YrrM